MTIREAILKALEDLKGNLSSNGQVYDQIIKEKYYDFKTSKTPRSTISAQLGGFIRNGDSRVKRIKNKQGRFQYFLVKYEDAIDINVIDSVVLNSTSSSQSLSTSYKERDLHKLLAAFLKNKGIYSKTIFHEKSKGSKDSHQKWVHPDSVGIKYLSLQNKNSQNLLKAVNRADIFKLYSYEIKREINTDYELKKYYFQAVSNSSWANYGYLVAYEINSSLYDEMERLNQSFGIGVIELNPNPYESKILLTSKIKGIDYKTLDKLCKINGDFDRFIEQSEKLLTATDRYYNSTEREFDEFCDDYFKSDSEIEDYVKKFNIPVKNSDEEDE